LQSPHLYPANPDGVPADLTQARPEFQRHAWLAMAGLTVFIAGYLALLSCFGWVTYLGVIHLQTEPFDLVRLGVTFSAGLLTLFMAKSLFAIRRAGNPAGIEVTASQQPELFQFIHRLADDIGAPKPHRVFLTPEVNAAVFYDLSLLNLFFPSKKNLIIGLGLVNVLSISELKAVLAHEFGHFAQRSMMVGRWVYIAQQIIGHMLTTRDWLDKLVHFIGRIDLRIAWLGWLLSLIIWSIRSVVDTLFSLVIMAERALSREMEFNADLVAVSVTGSDPLINALHKLQTADHAWQTALDVAHSEGAAGKKISDLFVAQLASIEAMRKVLDDEHYGSTPPVPHGDAAAQHRVFTAAMARPPQMWATHPANRDREDNAKARYIATQMVEHPAWNVFTNADALRRQMSASFYVPEKHAELEEIAETEAVFKRFSAASLHPEYRGNFLNRASMRNFSSVTELLQTGTVADTAAASIANLYPLELKAQLAAVRDLDIEIETLQALQRGELKPAGGVIRHRGHELKKADIPQAVSELSLERTALNEALKQHDANCHRAYLQAAAEIGAGWPAYLQSLVELLHCTEHLAAIARDEQMLLANTWAVITADGKVGHFEKRRMLKVAEKVQQLMRQLSAVFMQLELTDHLKAELGVDNWQEQCPAFDLLDVTSKNWGDWVGAAYERIDVMAHLLQRLSYLSLEELIQAEKQLGHLLSQPTTEEKGFAAPAPAPSSVPANYPVLMPGQENVLQRKLDLWNRFQLAQGTLPTVARLVVATAVVGGTIFAGFSYA
jgi:Zn-dependent protease with chaperone function